MKNENKTILFHFPRCYLNKDILDQGLKNQNNSVKTFLYRIFVNISLL
jgi:hypothetical protein